MINCLFGLWDGCLFPKSLPNNHHGHGMDSLFARADAIQPLSKKKNTKPDRKQGATHKNVSAKAGPSTDRTLSSVTQNTSLPKSLRPTSPPPANVPKHAHIKDLKLRTHLNRQAAHATRAKTLLQDAELLLTGDTGLIQTENDMEKTWRVSQDEIVGGAGQEAAKGRQEWKLDGGPYRSRYSKNGRFVGVGSEFVYWCCCSDQRRERHLAIVGNAGHVATFDWQTGAIHAELQLEETCRDITCVTL